MKRFLALAVILLAVPVGATGSPGPVIEFEFDGSTLTSWVEADGELLDIALRQGASGQRPVALAAEVLAVGGEAMATVALADATTSFVAYAQILYSPAEAPDTVVETTARAFFICRTAAACTQTSYSVYMVSTGAARIITNTEGERAIELELHRVSP